MTIDMRERLRMDRFLDKGSTSILQVAYIWEESKIMGEMVKAYFTLQIKIFILGNGKIMISLVQENFILFKTKIFTNFTMAILRTLFIQDLGAIAIRVSIILVSRKMINMMVMASSFHLKEPSLNVVSLNSIYLSKSCKNKKQCFLKTGLHFYQIFPKSFYNIKPFITINPIYDLLWNILNKLVFILLSILIV